MVVCLCPEELADPDELHGIQSKEQGLTYQFWVPMIVPRAHILPSLQDTAVAHHNAGTAESPSPYRPTPHLGLKEEGAPPSGQALWEERQVHGEV